MSDLVAIYEAGDEDVRLVTASNRVEWERTLEHFLSGGCRPRPRGCWTSDKKRARLESGEWIEDRYNRRRRHTSIG